MTIKESEWKGRFKARLIERGIHEGFASDATQEETVNPNCEPEIAADNLIGLLDADPAE